MSWTDILAGGVINPAYTVIVSYTPLTDFTLVWPSDSNDTNILGDIVELYAYVADIDITLPDATRGSAGGASLFINKGSQSVTLRDATGVAVGTVSPGTALFIYLASTNNPAGVWTAFVFAAGSSLAQAAALASSSVVARGNTLVQAAPVSSLNSDYTTGASDQGQVLNWVGGVGTFTLADAGVLAAGWFVHIRNSGTGALTLQIAPATLNTIDGATSLLFNPGESAICICDGARFITISKTITQINNFSYLSLDVSGTGVFNISNAQNGFSVYRLTGTLTGARQIVFPTTLQQFTVRNETTGAFTLTVKTAAQPGTVVGTNEAKIVYCDGSDIKPSSTAGVAFPIDITQGGTGATSAASALTNLGASTLGKSLFQAASATAARATLAFGSLGDLIAQAVSALQLPSGGIASPMYSFSADPDTGMYSRGANDLGFAIGGQDRHSFQDGFHYIFSGGSFKTVYHTGNLPNYQTPLGFTPVQQGGGVGQLTNTVKLGYNGAGQLKATIDVTDFGNVWTNAGVSSNGSSYVVLPNGLRIAWGSTGTLDATLGSRISFPIAFVGIPIVLATSRQPTGPRIVTIYDVDTTGFFAQSWSDTGAGSAAAASYIAIGF